MPEQTPTLSLPLIQGAQAQKHVTHNEAIELLDMLTQLTVEAFGATIPPGSPPEGHGWTIGTGATGAWAGRAGQIASWRGGGWLFVVPRDGWRAYGKGSGEIRVYSGGSWVAPAAAAPDFNNLSGVGIHATSDATNRLAVASDATLLTHAGAGHQLKLNKAASGDTASLLYQTGFSGRAELGLAGVDDFTVKVSADGSAWFDGLTVEGASGRVRIAQVLRLTPGAEPSSAAAGDLYFDSTSNKARCFDGTTWQDLF